MDSRAVHSWGSTMPGQHSARLALRLCLGLDYISSHRFKPMPMASVATMTLHFDRGSLKSCACWIRVAAGCELDRGKFKFCYTPATASPDQPEAIALLVGYLVERSSLFK